MSVLHDANLVPTNVRDGNALSGFLQRAGNTLTANTWYRLMPQGNTGALVTDEPRQLNIGVLRSDILDITNWILILLNTGYQQQLLVKEYNAADNVVTLTQPIQHTAGIRDSNLQSAIEFLLFPRLINPFGINYASESGHYMDIGWTLKDAYSPAAADIKQIDQVPSEEQLVLPYARIDRLFYRFPTVNDSVNYRLSWGEHYRG